MRGAAFRAARRVGGGHVQETGVSLAWDIVSRDGACLCRSGQDDFAPRMHAGLSGSALTCGARPPFTVGVRRAYGVPISTKCRTRFSIPELPWHTFNDDRYHRSKLPGPRHCLRPGFVGKRTPPWMCCGRASGRISPRARQDHSGWPRGIRGHIRFRHCRPLRSPRSSSP